MSNNTTNHDSDGSQTGLEKTIGAQSAEESIGDLLEQCIKPSDSIASLSRRETQDAGH